MDFYQLLDEKHSKSTTKLIVDEIAAFPKKIDELITIFLSEDIRMSQRAAWPISYIAEINPLIIEKNLNLFFTKLEQSNVHDACVRNLFRALQYINIPENMEGLIVTKAFDNLNNNKSAIAVKIFCMSILDELSNKYPDIKNELKVSIKSQFTEGSAGFKNRATKILKKIK